MRGSSFIARLGGRHQGGLRAFGKAIQYLPPAGFDRIALRCLEVAVQRRAPDSGDLLDVGRAALAPSIFIAVTPMAESSGSGPGYSGWSVPPAHGSVGR